MMTISQQKIPKYSKVMIYNMNLILLIHENVERGNNVVTAFIVYNENRDCETT